ncbi:MAG: putative toxin-antitoxin system toxin component, PIN family [Candidatus Vecturithrix sp.]|jgi:putative PIN family toxin of toxin-antitoxin system|nr:putative toxin-antitoxin system toxin component, PIN family [Candidatus Vecturithrix sp.]
MQAVIDTNILFSGLAPASPYFRLMEGIYTQSVTLLVSTPILLEYEEILRKVYSESILQNFFDFLHISDNVVFVNPTYRFQLPYEDADDQKFVDCAVCGQADFLITNDRHFRRLQNVSFPRVVVITGKEFLKRYLRQD